MSLQLNGGDIYCYYTLHTLSVFSLAKSLQLILEIKSWLKVSYLLADNQLICRLRAQSMMISQNKVKIGSLRRCICRYFPKNSV